MFYNEFLYIKKKKKLYNEFAGIGIKIKEKKKQKKVINIKLEVYVAHILSKNEEATTTNTV